MNRYDWIFVAMLAVVVGASVWVNKVAFSDGLICGGLFAFLTILLSRKSVELNTKRTRRG